MEEQNDGITNRKMTCHSGGTLEVFLEPMVTPLQLTVIGTSAIAQALCKLAKNLEYQVVALGNDCATLLPEADQHFDRFDDYEPRSEGYIVVCTQGEGDELALEYALKSNPQYCAFVASSKKAAVVSDYLRTKGISEDQINAIKAPAGLDLKASRPPEIALSILAEIVMTMRSGKQATKGLPPIVKPQAIDPICGMKVTKENAQHIAEYEGQSYYFCCGGCKMTFEASPQQYLPQ